MFKYESGGVYLLSHFIGSLSWCPARTFSGPFSPNLEAVPAVRCAVSSNMSPLTSNGVVELDTVTSLALKAAPLWSSLRALTDCCMSRTFPSILRSESVYSMERLICQPSRCLMLYHLLIHLTVCRPSSKGTTSKLTFTTLRKYKRPNFLGVIWKKLGFRYIRKAPLN